MRVAMPAPHVAHPFGPCGTPWQVHMVAAAGSLVPSTPVLPMCVLLSAKAGGPVVSLGANLFLFVLVPAVSPNITITIPIMLVISPDASPLLAP